MTKKHFSQLAKAKGFDKIKIKSWASPYVWHLRLYTIRVYKNNIEIGIWCSGYFINEDSEDKIKSDFTNYLLTLS